MLLGNESYTVGKPDYFPFKWCHICKNIHLCDEQQSWVCGSHPWKICQIFCTNAKQFLLLLLDIWDCHCLQNFILTSLCTEIAFNDDKPRFEGDAPPHHHTASIKSCYSISATIQPPKHSPCLLHTLTPQSTHRRQNLDSLLHISFLYMFKTWGCLKLKIRVKGNSIKKLFGFGKEDFTNLSWALPIYSALLLIPQLHIPYKWGTI